MFLVVYFIFLNSFIVYYFWIHANKSTDSSKSNMSYKESKIHCIWCYLHSLFRSNIFSSHKRDLLPPCYYTWQTVLRNLWNIILKRLESFLALFVPSYIFNTWIILTLLKCDLIGNMKLLSALRFKSELNLHFLTLTTI